MLHHLNHLCSSLYEVSMLSADGSHEVINGGTTKLGKSTLSSGRSNGRRAVELTKLLLLPWSFIVTLTMIWFFLQHNDFILTIFIHLFFMLFNLCVPIHLHHSCRYNCRCRFLSTLWWLPMLIMIISLSQLTLLIERISLLWTGMITQRSHQNSSSRHNHRRVWSMDTQTSRDAASSISLSKYCKYAHPSQWHLEDCSFWIVIYSIKKGFAWLSHCTAQSDGIFLPLALFSGACFLVCWGNLFPCVCEGLVSRCSDSCFCCCCWFCTGGGGGGFSRFLTLFTSNTPSIKLWWPGAANGFDRLWESGSIFSGRRPYFVMTGPRVVSKSLLLLLPVLLWNDNVDLMMDESIMMTRIANSFDLKVELLNIYRIISIFVHWSGGSCCCCRSVASSLSLLNHPPVHFLRLLLAFEEETLGISTS